MKVSKSLLTAIAAGIFMTSMTSCEKIAIEEPLHMEASEECPINQGRGYEDCPACGLG